MNSNLTEIMFYCHSNLTEKNLMSLQVNSAVMALAPTLMQLIATNTTYINGNDPGSQLAPAVRRTTSKTQSIFTYFVLLLYNVFINFWSD